jgi:hypothetical protein
LVGKKEHANAPLKKLSARAHRWREKLREINPEELKTPNELASFALVARTTLMAWFLFPEKTDVGRGICYQTPRDVLTGSSASQVPGAVID